MDNNKHVCLGSCHAAITQEQYDQGLTACGAEDCEMKGQPFVKGQKCAQCGSTFKEGESHSCTDNA